MSPSQFFTFVTVFALGVTCGVVGYRQIDGEREGVIRSLREQMRAARQERDEWKKRHDDLHEQWEREKRPRPFRESIDPKTAVSTSPMDHSTWGDTDE